MIDLAERQLDEAGIETAHLAGNSLGGWVALHLAARGRARSVVAICPAGGWVHGGRDGRRILRFFARNYRLMQIGGKRLERMTANPRWRALAMRDVVAKPGNVSEEVALRALHSSAGCSILRDALVVGRRDGLGDLDRIDVPVRIAYGVRDRLIRYPRCFERFHTLIPDAEWVPLEGVGHLAMWDDPELVTRTILEVTERAEAQTAAAS
jgi:pimeloyl-ACP methyl ester carboxylesterase